MPNGEPMESRVARLETQMGEVSKTLEALHTKVDSLQGKWFSAACVLIMMLVGIIGYLLTSGVPWTGGAI